MKKLLLLLLFAGLLNTGSVFGWGREGHETIAKIAERNLTKKAKKRIEKYLGGHSIVYFAKWMDEYRHTPEYKFTNNWHTVPVNAELRYEDSMLAKNGNAIYGLEQAIENLKNYRSLTDSAVEVNLKYIIIWWATCTARRTSSTRRTTRNTTCCSRTSTTSRTNSPSTASGTTKSSPPRASGRSASGPMSWTAFRKPKDRP